MCAAISLRTRKTKPLAGRVTALLLAVTPPVIGNIIILESTNAVLSIAGMYLCFFGTDAIVITLLLFTLDYCAIKRQRRILVIAIAFVVIDVAQLALNPVTGLSFRVRELFVEGAPYFAPAAHAGLVFHRIGGYALFAAIAGFYIYKMATSSRIYFERYAIILASLLVAALWQGFYVASGSPIDKSMIAFGVAALLIFYFALYYRPFRLLDRMLSRIVTSMDQAVFFFEDSAECIYANSAAYALLGLPKDEGSLQDVNRHITKKLGAWNHKFGEDWSETRRIGSGDEERYYELQMQQVVDHNGQRAGAAFTVRDTTEIEHDLERERHQATHEPLTDLYNEAHLHDCTRKLIDENPNIDYVVVGMDMKDFKLVNDIFGKEYGDKVLCALADAIRTAATPGSAYGHIRGDKFGFIAQADRFSAERVERELLNFSFDGMDKNMPVVIHMGVYEVTEPELSPSAMYDRAFMALASIKQELNVRVAFYSEEMRERTLWSQTISTQLEPAINSGQIRLYLQPQVDAQGKIEGAEVLVRWLHPEEGLLPPARFIPVFEENGMIARLDAYVWECACRILKEWQQQGIDYFISVNISPKDFYFIDVYAGAKLRDRPRQAAPRNYRGRYDDRHRKQAEGHRRPALERLHRGNGRLRQRLFVVEHAERPSGRRAEDRHGVPLQDRVPQKGPDDSWDHHRPFRPTGHSLDCRRRRNGRAVIDARSNGLQAIPGLLLRQAHARRGIRATRLPHRQITARVGVGRTILRLVSEWNYDICRGRFSSLHSSSATVTTPLMTFRMF